MGGNALFSRQRAKSQLRTPKRQKTKKLVSFEPDSNQRPKDSSCNLYSPPLYQLSYRRDGDSGDEATGLIHQDHPYVTNQNNYTLLINNVALRT